MSNRCQRCGRPTFGNQCRDYPSCAPTTREAKKRVHDANVQEALRRIASGTAGAAPAEVLIARGTLRARYPEVARADQWQWKEVEIPRPVTVEEDFGEQLKRDLREMDGDDLDWFEPSPKKKPSTLEDDDLDWFT